MKLTKRQQEIVHFMREYLAENDNMPTHKEVATVFGFASENASFEHFQALARKKVIERMAWGSYKWRFVRVKTTMNIA